MKRLLLFAVTGVLLLTACPSEGDDEASTPERPAFEAPDFAEGSILFVRGTRLQLYDGGSKEETHVADLESADVTVSPDGAVAAYVKAGGSDEDFVEDPVVGLLEIASGKTSEVGPGLSPSFSSSGNLMAMLEPVGARNCEGEVCSGDVRVVMGPPGEELRVVGDPGRWVVLGWAGERLLVADGDDPTGVELYSVGAEPIRLDVSPSSVWGGSPSGDRLLLLAGDGFELRVLEAGKLGSESTLVALEGSLGQGAWSRDGRRVAAVVVGQPKGGIPRTELATIAIEATSGSRVETVPDSEGAIGQVLWGRAGGSVAYVRSAPPRGLNLEAIRCESPPDGSCESLFSWKRGVTLLHLY